MRFTAVPEKSLGCIASRTCNDGEVTVLIYRRHLINLLGFIRFVVLNDADCVDPEKTHPQMSTDRDGVLERFWELLILKAFYQLGNPPLFGFQRLVASPAVAQRY